MDLDTDLDATADRARATELEKPPSLAPAAKASMLSAALKADGMGSTLRKTLGMMSGPGRLTFDEICYYRLLDPGMPTTALRRFVGKRRQAVFHRACNNPHWYAAAHDKALFYTIMAGVGLPVPETIAVSGGRPRAGYAYHLASADAVADFLLHWSEWPVFIKPVDGMFSLGALRISGADDGRLAVDGCGMLPARRVARYMAAMSAEGCLVQRCLAPVALPSLDPGMAVPSVRMLVLLGADGPHIESAVLKLPAAGAIADNFWRTGNLLGALDPDTGEVTRVVSGVGLQMQTLDHLPGAGQQSDDIAIPGWGAVCGHARCASEAFPGLRTQSWDIALTDRGPVVLEVNFGGDFNLHQLAHRRGVLSDRYVEHLARCGLNPGRV